MCVPATSARVLVYNRVPKTGSTSVKTAVNALRRPGLRMFSLTNEQSQLRESAEFRQRRMQGVCDLVVDGVPLVFISGHFNFVELSESPQCRPPPSSAYVNLIREPVSRLVSSYHYHFSDRHVAQLRELERAVETGGAASERALDPAALRSSEHQRQQLRDAAALLKDASGAGANVTLDECAGAVLDRARAGGEGLVAAAAATPCAKPLLSLQWPYFCGFGDECSVSAALAGGRGGLDTALRNLKARYLLVGLTEQFNATVTALELLAPQFFEGLPAEAHRVRADRASSNAARAHEEPAEDTLAFLRELSKETGDWEFYFQAKKHFHRKLACLLQRLGGTDA